MSSVGLCDSELVAVGVGVMGSVGSDQDGLGQAEDELIFGG